MVLAAQDRLIQIWDINAYGQIAIEPEVLGRLAEEIFKSE